MTHFLKFPSVYVEWNLLKVTTDFVLSVETIYLSILLLLLWICENIANYLLNRLWVLSHVHSTRFVSAQEFILYPLDESMNLSIIILNLAGLSESLLFFHPPSSVMYNISAAFNHSVVTTVLGVLVLPDRITFFLSVCVRKLISQFHFS